MKAVVGWHTDVGQVRSINQDSYLVLTGASIRSGLDAVLVVADGMGGHQAGEVASRMLVEHFAAAFSASTEADAESVGDLAMLIESTILDAGNHILKAAGEDEALRGMGTTATAVIISRDRAYVGHVGDSRAYLLRNGGVSQITADHSWVAGEVRAGRITEEEAANHPRKNILMQAVGSSGEVKVDSAVYELQVGDRLLLCSDGLSNLVNKGEFLESVTPGADLNRAAAHLVALANERGAPDNATVVLAEVVDEIPVAPAPPGPELRDDDRPTLRGIVVPLAPQESEKSGPTIEDVLQEPAPLARTSKRGRGLLGFYVALLVLVAAGVAAVAISLGWFGAK